MKYDSGGFTECTPCYWSFQDVFYVCFDSYHHHHVYFAYLKPIYHFRGSKSRTGNLWCKFHTYLLENGERCHLILITLKSFYPSPNLSTVPFNHFFIHYKWSTLCHYLKIFLTALIRGECININTIVNKDEISLIKIYSSTWIFFVIPSQLFYTFDEIWSHI